MAAESGRDPLTFHNSASGSWLGSAPAASNARTTSTDPTSTAEARGSGSATLAWCSSSSCTMAAGTTRAAQPPATPTQRAVGLSQCVLTEGFGATHMEERGKGEAHRAAARLGRPFGTMASPLPHPPPPLRPEARTGLAWHPAPGT
jgi:hypothetical protein